MPSTCRIAPLTLGAPVVPRSSPSPPTMIGAPPNPPRPKPPPPPPPPEAPAPGPLYQAAGPPQGQVLHRRLIDLRQRAVAAPGEVAGVGRPRVGQWLEQCGRIEPAGRRRGRGRGGGGGLAS